MPESRIAQPLLRSLINAALFQLGWWACVLSNDGALLLIPAACLAAHFIWVGSWAREGKLVVSVMLAGSALDTFLMQLGVFDFGAERRLLPLWLALMWALLATTLHHSLAWSAKPWWRASVLGAIGGPLAYFGGAQLANIGLPLGTLATLALLSITWAVVMPLTHGFAQLYDAQYRLRLAAAKQAQSRPV
ncbi:DUF2878 domain-containing protein [Atopomonas sediminilitoris]|uniref:DUF2878 domain-containing protein n=1 Tax=Atopomonas sediminilitoris TaxID=2919919 RepID=UPI001F4ED3A1|nr:DUF2878 domain-containing protein [Atopomonas sediminilitoris]MCJ8168096.1 DUF2878 domain-containing protein [Atopomonas sediminilitoris]